MANSKNEVIIEGNLVRDPASEIVGKGLTVCNFSIASNRWYKIGDNFEKETSYFDVQAWGTMAEDIQAKTSKGTALSVKGRLKQERWEKDGIRHSKVLIVAYDYQIIEKTEKASGQTENRCPF